MPTLVAQRRLQENATLPKFAHDKIKNHVSNKAIPLSKIIILETVTENPRPSGRKKKSFYGSSDDNPKPPQYAFPRASSVIFLCAFVLFIIFNFMKC